MEIESKSVIIRAENLNCKKINYSFLKQRIEIFFSSCYRYSGFMSRRSHSVNCRHGFGDTRYPSGEIFCNAFT